MLAAASSFFLASANEWLFAKGRTKPTRQQLCCAIVSASVMAIPLCQFTIYGFAPARALLMVCVLICAKLWHEAGGAVAGIALGAVMAVSGEAFTISGICAVAGLVSALFVPVGTIMSASAFTAVCSLGAFASGGIDLFFLAEALVASVIFALIRTEKLESYLLRNHRKEVSARLSDATSERLLAAGALDVWTTPITMKKGRPAVMLSCLAKPEQEQGLTALMLRHTTTLGVRAQDWKRTVLERQTETVDTPFGPMRRKKSAGCGISREKWEYEDLAAAAEKYGLSLAEIKARLGSV